MCSILLSDQVNQQLYDSIYYNEMEEFDAIVKARGIKWLEEQLNASRKLDSLVHRAVDNLPNIPEIRALPTNYVAIKLFQLLPRCIEYTDREGYTPLHLLARKGNVVGIRCLLSHRANVNARDNRMLTPLHHAVLGNFTSVTAELLHANSNVVEAQDELGNTPMHYAASGGVKFDILDLLNQHKNRSLTIRNLEGRTPVQAAALENNDDTLSLLCDDFPTNKDDSLTDEAREKIATFKRKLLSESRKLTSAKAIEDFISNAKRRENSRADDTRERVIGALSDAMTVRKMMKAQFQEGKAASEEGVQASSKKRKAETQLQIQEEQIQGEFVTALGPEHRRLIEEARFAEEVRLAAQAALASNLEVNPDSFLGVKRRKTNSQTEKAEDEKEKAKDEKEKAEDERKVGEAALRRDSSSSQRKEEAADRAARTLSSNSSLSSVSTVESEQLPSYVQIKANKYPPNIRFTAADLRAAGITLNFSYPSSTSASWDQIGINNVKWVINKKLHPTMPWPHAWLRKRSDQGIVIMYCSLLPLPKHKVKELESEFRKMGYIGTYFSSRQFYAAYVNHPLVRPTNNRPATSRSLSAPEQLPAHVQIKANKYPPAIRFTAADLRAAGVSLNFSCPTKSAANVWDNIEFNNVKWVINQNINPTIPWPHAWTLSTASNNLYLVLQPLPQHKLKDFEAEFNHIGDTGESYYLEYTQRSIYTRENVTVEADLPTSAR